MFREIRKIIKEARIRAHLWPPTLTGVKSWEVKRLMNQPWRVNRRLFSHRGAGEGKRSHGRIKAKAIRGMPKRVGLIN